MLGRELKRLREKAGLSLRGMGKLIGKHHSYVTRVESGQQFIDFATLLDFARFCGGRASDIVRQIEDETESSPQ